MKVRLELTQGYCYESNPKTTPGLYLQYEYEPTAPMKVNLQLSQVYK